MNLANYTAYIEMGLDQATRNWVNEKHTANDVQRYSSGLVFLFSSEEWLLLAEGHGRLMQYAN